MKLLKTTSTQHPPPLNIHHHSTSTTTQPPPPLNIHYHFCTVDSSGGLCVSVCMTTISLYIFHPYGGGQRRTGTLYSNKEHCPTSFVFSFLFRALFFFFCFFIFFYLFFFDHSCFFLSFFCDVSLIHSSIQHQTNNKNTKQTILKKTSNTKQKLKKKHQTQNKN